jgi:uncharacterized membrane protein
VDSRRLESFSDGVFAVAITVLVFNLLTIGAKGPGLSFRLLLGDAWPQYFAYVVGFLSIGIMWLNHHTLVLHVAAVDRATLVLNIFLLMTVVAVPFPTALVAEHLRNSGAADAVVSYGVVMILLSISYASLWSYVLTHQKALAAAGSSGVRFIMVLRFSGGLFGYIAGTLIAAFWSPIAGLVIFGLLAVYYLFEHLPRPAGDSPDPDAGLDGAVTG